jgi:hypothetical protein
MPRATMLTSAARGISSHATTTVFIPNSTRDLTVPYLPGTRYHASPSELSRRSVGIPSRAHLAPMAARMVNV